LNRLTGRVVAVIWPFKNLKIISGTNSLK
jgi:hypothetical protein